MLKFNSFVGNADPNALQLAVATMQGCHLLGMPECDCLLAQCAIYLARAPKSREADSALAAAKQVIQDWKGPQPSVPMHIRNAPTKLMKELGEYGLGLKIWRICQKSRFENVPMYIVRLGRRVKSHFKHHLRMEI